MKVLLDLKAQYQKAAGKAWQPGAKAEVKAAPTATASAPSVSGSNQKEELLAKIEAQGSKVRQLKDSGASKVSGVVLFTEISTTKETFTRFSV